MRPFNLIGIGLALLAVAGASGRPRSVVNAAWFGFDPVNSTKALQAAIDSGADVVIVPNMGGDWIVDPIFLASNQEIDFNPGVVVTARKGGYPGLNDCLFRATGKHDVTLRGYGATFRMQKAECTTGEWRMCLKLDSCTNVSVLGLTLRDSGGDGIMIGGTDPQQPYSRNVVVRDCVMANNKRQGMSVISASNLLVQNCVFRDTNGTAPSAGVDLEPDLPSQRLEGCAFQDCVMDGNAGDGAMVYIGRLTDPDALVSVRFERCTMRNSGGAGIEVGGSVPASPDRYVTFTDCLVQTTKEQGFGLFDHGPDSVAVTFQTCTWRNVARGTAAHPLPLSWPARGSGTYPFLLYAWYLQSVGGVDFEGCLLEDDRIRPFLMADDSVAPNGVGGIHGTITVRTLGAAWMDLGPVSHDVTLKVH